MKIVIIGGGVVGLMTAVECCRARRDVDDVVIDIVEADTVPNPRAASHGQLRVVRALHRDDPALTMAAAATHASWMEAESVLGTRCYLPVGALTMLPADDVAAHVDILAAAGGVAWPLTPDDLRQAYPHLITPPDTGAVLEARAGVILADHLLAAMVGWLGAQDGVRLHARRPVVDIDPADSGVAVQLADGAVLRADRVLVAAGAWSRALLPPVITSALVLHRQSVLSCRPTRELDRWARTPVVLGLSPARDAWIIPPVGGAPAQVSAASACARVATITDWTASADERRHLRNLFQQQIPDIADSAASSTQIRYYLGEESRGGPLLATYGNGSVWAYAACGGMSFKFAPMIARSLADRVVGRPGQHARWTGLGSIDRPMRIDRADVLEAS